MAANDDDDLVTLMINGVVGLVVLMVEVSAAVVTMCFLAIAFVLEVIFDWGDGQ